MKVRKCPTDELAVSNCAVISREDFDAEGISIFNVNMHLQSPNLLRYYLASYEVKSNQYIGSITLSADFQLKKNATAEPLNCDLMAREFSIQFGGMAFTKGEVLVFQFMDKEKGKTHTLSLIVKNIDGEKRALVFELHRLLRKISLTIFSQIHLLKFIEQLDFY
uniref:CDC48_2 domain-containing protein n=1 Tax=Heterorhabditis bacteriophora TaxID=37862 RepID=A0A1I7WNC9_HETBA